jgi:hypothetical protein
MAEFPQPRRSLRSPPASPPTERQPPEPLRVESETELPCLRWIIVEAVVKEPQILPHHILNCTE